MCERGTKDDAQHRMLNRGTQQATYRMEIVVGKIQAATRIWALTAVNHRHSNKCFEKSLIKFYIKSRTEKSVNLGRDEKNEMCIMQAKVTQENLKQMIWVCVARERECKFLFLFYINAFKGISVFIL